MRDFISSPGQHSAMLGAVFSLLLLINFAFCNEDLTFSSVLHSRGGRFIIQDAKLGNRGLNEAVLDFGEDVGAPRHCDGSNPPHLACIDWIHQNQDGGSSLRVTTSRGANGHSQLSIVIARRDVKPLSLCIPLNGETLFGGPLGDAYPSQRIIKEMAPYVTGEGKETQSTGPIAETKWLTSGGRAIHVKPGSPLFVSQNSSTLCFYVKNEPPYTKNAPIRLECDMCLTENAKQAWTCLNADSHPKPLARQYDYIVREPIWSTWVAFKANISQQTVTGFANKIKRHRLRAGVIEIDDKWETCYGSQKLDQTKFPNPKKMIEEIHSMGAKVTFWIHPFVDEHCKEFRGLEKHLFKLANGSIGKTNWWNGQAGLINFLKKDTYEFFKNRLEWMKGTYGADGFKFDAGEAYYIPALFEETPLANPNEYTTTYVKLAEEFGQATEVRVGADTTSFGLFTRILDTNTVWTLKGYGLKSVLTTTLQLSAMGYRAIMPDMIGGNCYGQKLDKELFIRWVQLTAFLPVMQFSFPPWEFDDETVQITRKYIELHHQHSNLILRGLNNTNAPITAPVWWLCPNCSAALEVDDEFLVGDGLDWILVAPVVENGGRSRSIYFPPGRWTDRNSGHAITGPVTVANYSAPLSKLPYFTKQRTEESSTPESNNQIFVIGT